jgi:O-antigen/teichoic acid export membrane protein
MLNAGVRSANGLRARGNRKNVIQAGKANIMFAAKQTLALPRLGGIVERLRGGGDAAVAQRGALFAFSIRVASAGLAYLSQILLARWIGVFEFGVFAYVWVFVLILGGLSTIGLNTSVLRFLPAYREARSWDLYHGFLLSSRFVVIGVSSLVLAGGLALTWYLSGKIADYYLVPLVIAFFCLPGYAITDIQDGISRSESWIDLALIPPYIQRPLLLLIFLAAAMALGFEANAVTALGAALASTYVTTISQYVLLRRRIGERAGTSARSYQLPLWLMVSAPILLMHSFYMLMHHVDILVLNVFVTPADIAIYYAAIKTTSLVAFVHFSVTAAYSARFSEYHAAGRNGDLAAHVREAVKWTFWPSLFATACILVAGLPLLWLFGPEFTAGYPVMFVFAVGLLVRASLGPAETLLTVLGHQKICAAIMCAALIINIILNFTLIPQFGILGAAAATVGAIVVESGLLVWIIKRRLGLHAFVFGGAPVAGGTPPEATADE